MDGCKHCGQSTVNCQCLKFDKSAPRNGSTMKDLSLSNPLQSFLHYAAPHFAHNHNMGLNSTHAKTSNSQSDNDGGLGTPAGFSASGTPNGGPSF